MHPSASTEPLWQDIVRSDYGEVSMVLVQNEQAACGSYSGIQTLVFAVATLQVVYLASYYDTLLFISSSVLRFRLSD